MLTTNKPDIFKQKSEENKKQPKLNSRSSMFGIGRKTRESHKHHAA
jgi:hypothetical protein